MKANSLMSNIGLTLNEVPILSMILRKFAIIIAARAPTPGAATVFFSLEADCLDDLDNAEDVVYTGQGGHDLTGNKRQIRDQVMERGNLALKVCCLRSKNFLFYCYWLHCCIIFIYMHLLFQNGDI